MVLIQDITDERKTTNSNDNDDTAINLPSCWSVNETLERFVEHYMQPIHRLWNDDIHETNNDNERDNSPLPPMLAQFAQRMDTHENNAPTLLLLGYKTHVRKTFQEEKYDGAQIYLNEDGVSVLWNFERLVREVCRLQWNGTQDEQHTIINHDDESLLELMYITCSDVTRCSGLITSTDESPERSEEESTPILVNTVQRYVLPTLLRLQLHTLRLLQIKYSSKTNIDHDLQCRVAIQCLALDTEALTLPESMIKSLTDLNQFWDHPDKSIQIEIMKWDLDFLGRIRELEASYLDHRQLKGLIVQLRHTLWPDYVSRHSFMSYFSIDHMAQSIKAHFFGRDEPSSLIVTKKQEMRSRLHLGKTIIEPVPETETSAPHIQFPSRMISLLHFILCLGEAGGDAAALNTQVLDHILPILYQLLNSEDILSVECGAICTYHLISILQNDEGEATWRENLRLLVHRRIQVTREPLALGVLGLCQQVLVAQLSLDAIIGWMRLVSQWLRPPYDRVRAMLLGGVLPWLKRLTPLERMDVFRATLVAVLPLLQDVSSIPDDVVDAACVTLSLVLEAPVLAQHHGGKLMATMLKVLMTKSNSVRLFVAGMIVVAGGDRASEVLDRLLHEDGCDLRLKHVCEEVQEQAELVRNMYRIETQ